MGEVSQTPRHQRIQALQLCALMGLASITAAIVSGTFGWWTACNLAIVSIFVWLALFVVTFTLLIRSDRADPERTEGT
jgi:hypothetical protein